MHTGVDLPDDLLRVQVIARLPFPDMGDPLVKAQMKNATKDNPLDKGQRAYNYDTAAGLVQAYGRIMRSEDDWGTTYLLDPAWSWFRHAARDVLPQWFTGALQYPVTPGASTSQVRHAGVDKPDQFLNELFNPRKGVTT
jgi:ATP-dependent DNA helicase DinG